ncbi:hypothetical protein [Luteolibacter sp. LG18]|uniref:hypothetical protein n=1 Tax=Luteolibacter sp. LG18 TaxID=2819286 RepID=UPI002B2A5E4F|nr:hypothetical protein llg_06670 [Luteolibacter sp. LG18]
MRVYTTLGMIVTTVLAAGVCHAKRAAPAEVKPVVYGDYTLSAPNQPANAGQVMMTDNKGKEVRHVLKVYQYPVDPLLEKDVQWVFITALKLEGDVITVTDEKNKTYTVDLREHLKKCTGCK